MEQLLNQLGLGAALVIALPTYTFFKFLDSKASDEANAAISAWIKGEKYESLSIGEAVLAGFKNIYGDHLLRLATFFRSAVLTTCVASVYYVYFFFRINQNTPDSVTASEVFSSIGYVATYILPLIIISDYCSLFVVRRALQTVQSSLFTSVALALLAGTVAIAIVALIEWRISRYFFGFLDFLDDIVGPPRTSDVVYGVLQTIGPAFLVHLWLPLFLLGGAMSSAARIFFKAVSKAQWTIARGDQHPLEAIGLMASIFVFVVTVVVQKAGALV